MDQLKVHIDSNLIKSTSTVPDELKDLGVSVYNENEFEKGVLLQVDIQLAEYELNKIKNRMKKIGVQENLDEDANDNSNLDTDQINLEESSNSNQPNDEVSQIKKRKHVKYLDTIEQYKEKKLRLESKFEDYKNYMKNIDEPVSGISSSSNDSEDLIKTGEMTPFGTMMNFNENQTGKDSHDKPTTSKASIMKTSNKQMKLTDFESFLVNCEKKAKSNEKKVGKNQKPNLEKSKSDVNKIRNKTVVKTEPTDFEKFLLGSDNEPIKSKFDKIPISSAKTKSENSNSSITITKVKPKIEKIKSDQVVTDFDKFILESESKAKEAKEKKKIEFKKSLSKNSSKSIKMDTEKKKVEKVEKKRSNEDLSNQKPSSEVLSFINAIEEDEDEEKETLNKNDFDSEATNMIISRVKRNVEINNKKLAIDSDDENIEETNDETKDTDYLPEDDEDEENEDDKYDEDYVDDNEDDGLSANNSDVEYETDSDSENSGKKKNLRKCNDDGDENLFLKRLKKLDKLEKETRKDSNDNEPEYVEFQGGFRVPLKIWDKLYKFQKTGVKWLWELHSQRCGGILGDEMGLGKTIQMISFLASVKYSKIRSFGFNYIGLGPTLIIAPTTLISQWVDEFHQWWPYFRVAVLHDIGTYSETPKHRLINQIFKCNGILITTYSSLLIYEQYLLSYNWHYVILDEGHKIRNPDAKITVACKCFRTPHRIILSGSPIQNNLKELWSLFDFIFPGKLGTLPSFMENFSVPIVQGGYSNATDVQVQTAYKCASLLKDTITPYLLRRNKNDVQISIQLPAKNEQVLFCRLSDEQKEQYLRYVKSSDCTDVLNKKTSVFRALMYLRKLCNHVDIVTNIHCDSKINNEKYSYGYYKRSGKMIVVETLLKLWKKQENRVLLFTQSRKMLEIIESFVKSQNYEYLRMDGTTPVPVRNRYVKEFNTNSNVFIFILTTKVGGLGLNLIGANRIIIFDPDWNPSTDMQARERAWRIGQTKNVTIYRLLTAGTIEEKIYHRQIFKQFLTNKVLNDPKQKRFFKTNDLYELFSYGALDDNSTLESSALFAGTNSEIKKSKLKYSKMDGERVPGLMKKYDNKTAIEESDQTENNDKHKDDYVLNKLFKSRKRNGGKSSIHTAIQHDLIVNNTDPDFALVEAEADRVAADAIKSLKQSRKYCHPAESGIPNLTGIKFGSRSKLLSFDFNNKNDSDDEKVLNDNAPLSSSALIERMQMRNNMISITNNDDNDESNPGTSTSDSDKYTKLADDLRTYILYGASNLGEASTEEIIEHFRGKIDKNNTIKFKSLLKKICFFHRTAYGIGFWKLKDEFK